MKWIEQVVLTVCYGSMAENVHLAKILQSMLKCRILKKTGHPAPC